MDASTHPSSAAGRLRSARLALPGVGAGRLILEAEFGEPPLEQPPTDPLARLTQRRRPALYELTRSIRSAATDRRVVALIAHLGTGRLPLATAAELRAAVTQFRASGKPTVVWTETFGEGRPATAAYYLASAFAEIWLQPSGELGLAGLATQPLFFAGLLERIGISVEMDARHEYKSAAEPFTRTGLSPAARQAGEALLRSAFATVTSAVAADRGLGEPAVRAAAAASPSSAAAAREAGFVDRLGYRDEVYTALRARVGADPKPRYLLRYRPSPAWRARLPIGDRRRVALITGQGTIRLGGAPRAGLAPSMLAGRICAALRAAREDPRIAAVVFRVNSPGGSYVASDAVAREVGCCRAAGKPVVVTMGEVAASGGYFVAAPADVIVAQPATVTGSIGVLGGKPVLAELLARIGVSHDAIETDPAARMMSVLRRFSDAERSRFAEFLDAIYADFVAKVAAGRGLSPAAVDAVARGRVWTGADAAERGLVDVLGGITEAAGIARERAGLAADAPLVRYPDPGGWRRLRPPASSADPRPAAGTGPLAGSGVAASSALLAGTGLLPGSDWGPLAGLAAELGLPGSGLLTMPALPLP